MFSFKETMSSLISEAGPLQTILSCCLLSLILAISIQTCITLSTTVSPQEEIVLTYRSSTPIGILGQNITKVGYKWECLIS